MRLLEFLTHVAPLAKALNSHIELPLDSERAEALRQRLMELNPGAVHQSPYGGYVFNYNGQLVEVKPTP